MRERFKTISRILFLVLACGAIAFMALNARDLLPLLQRPRELNVTGLMLAFSMQVLFWAALSHIWVKLLRHIGNVEVSTWLAFLQQGLVSLGKYFPGKVWGMIARGGQMRLQGIEMSVVAKTTYLEQLLLLHGGVALIGLLTLCLYDSLALQLLGALAVISVPIAAILHDKLLSLLSTLIQRFWPDDKRPDLSGLSARRYIAFTSQYALVWLLSGFVFVGLYIAFIDQQPSLQLILVLVLANTAGIWSGFMAFFAPGGIGVREAASIAIMAPFMPIEHAIALSILSRIWLLLMDFVAGALALWRFRRVLHAQ